MARAPRQFKGASASSAKARRRAYDKFRPNAHRRLYGRCWRRAAKAFLAENPLCRACASKSPPRDELATEVDHIRPHRGDLALFWDRDNWQPLCKPCHSAKTAAEQRGEG